jgi:sulfur relay protein TusB/DsrH
MKYLIWIYSKSNNFEEVIKALKSQSVEVDVLLLQDGVYLADRGSPSSQTLKALGVGIHALENHVEERGISNRLIAGVDLVNYDQMLDLMMEKTDKVISI